MAAFADIDWMSTSETEHMAFVRRASPDELNQLLCRYDWAQYPESVLGWATAQKGLDLCAAMTAFFNADPMRFNYMPRADIPAAYHGQCRLLDAIAQRVNAGFYLPGMAGMPCAQLGKLRAWVHYQQEDRFEHRRGRWVFEEDLLGPLLNPTDESAPVIGPVVQDGGVFGLGSLMKPLMNF